MNAERWARVRELFETAGHHPPATRSVWLETACTGDEALREEVEQLLDASDAAGGFLERPAVSELGMLLACSPAASDLVQPQVIGPYHVIRRIAQGGMGVVYLARREGHEQVPPVAVKVIKQGMDTELVVARFRHEQDILAALDHPNIARLLDGGATDDGRPYFVMEHIEGEPIHSYCDSQGHSTAQRLALFLQVCAAVSYAHRHLVVHRDIKPGNILVTPNGVPMLLDFGLAKVLHPELPEDPSSRTITAMRMLTPDYASPEQVRGERATTSTDVYSLGVLLFELLTGRRPYRVASHTPDEIVRLICEAEPEWPTGPRRLPVDLATIVKMALRKEVQRRYTSVDQFAEDIRRYLDGLPVMARKDTFAYRTGKFLRRHRAAMAAASLVVVATIAGVAATVWQAREAESQRARAERRFRDLRSLAGTLLFELDEAILDLPGSTRAREILVKHALGYLSTLGEEGTGDLTLQRELAVAFSRVGEVQARGFGLDLGEVSGALDSFHRAMLIRQKLVDADPANLQDQDDLAESLLRLAQVMGRMGDATDDIAYARQAVTIREVLVAADPARATFRSGLAAAYETLGNALMRDGEQEEMLSVFRKLQALREELVGSDPDGGRARCNLADAYWNVGLAEALLGEHEQALATWALSESILEGLVNENPGSERTRSSLMRAYTQIGGTLNARGQRQDGLTYLRKAVSIGETLFATDPQNAEVRHRLAETYRDLGEILAAASARAEANEVLQRATNLLEPWRKANPANVQIAVTLAGVYEALGLAHEPPSRPGSTAPRDAGWRQARSWYGLSLDIWHDLAASDRLARLYRARADRVAETVVRCDAALVGKLGAES